MNQKILSFGGGGRRGFADSGNYADIESVWLNPLEAVPLDAPGYLPAPSIRLWYYNWHAKKRFLAYGVRAGAEEVRAFWEISVPYRWNAGAVKIEPFWTYKYGFQGWMNPDQPAYVAGNFQWRAGLVVLHGAEVPNVTEENNVVNTVTWDVASVDIQDEVYKGNVRSVVPDDPQAGGIDRDCKILCQFNRIDIVDRIVDVAGIRLTFSLTP